VGTAVGRSGIGHDAWACVLRGGLVAPQERTVAVDAGSNVLAKPCHATLHHTRAWNSTLTAKISLRTYARVRVHTLSLSCG